MLELHPPDVDVHSIPDLPVKGRLELDYVFVRPKEVSRRCVRVKHALDLTVRAVARPCMPTLSSSLLIHDHCACVRTGAMFGKVS